MTAADRLAIVEALWERSRSFARLDQRTMMEHYARLVRLVESWPVLPAVACDGGTGPGVVVWVYGGIVEGVYGE